MSKSKVSLKKTRNKTSQKSPKTHICSLVYSFIPSFFQYLYNPYSMLCTKEDIMRIKWPNIFKKLELIWWNISICIRKNKKAKCLMSLKCCRPLLGSWKKPSHYWRNFSLGISLPIKQKRQTPGERLWVMVPLRATSIKIPRISLGISH